MVPHSGGLAAATCKGKQVAGGFSTEEVMRKTTAEW